MSRKKYTDKELLDELRRLDDECRGTVTTGDIRKKAGASTWTYARRFGSIPEAREKAGVGGKSGHEIRADYVKITDSELIDELKRLKKQLGRPPSATDIDNFAEFCYDTYIDRFGTMSDARQRAGLQAEYDFKAEKNSKEKKRRECHHCGKEEWVQPSHANQKYCSRECMGRDKRKHSTSEVLSELEQLAEDLGRAPTAREYRKKTGIFHGTFESREELDGYSEELRKLGYRPQGPQDVSDEELLDDIRQLTERLETPPTKSDMREHGLLRDLKSYRERWGSWFDALQAAGVDPPVSRQFSVPEETLIEEYQRLADELGEVPSWNDVRRDGKFAATTYENKFGSFLAAKEAAGYAPEPSRHNMLTGEAHPAWNGEKERPYDRNWMKQRELALERDGERCVRCGTTSDEHLDETGVDLHVHHITPWYEFENEENRNALENLVTLCASCHKKIEALPVVPEFGAVAGQSDE